MGWYEGGRVLSIFVLDGWGVGWVGGWFGIFGKGFWGKGVIRGSLIVFCDWGCCLLGCLGFGMVMGIGLFDVWIILY